MKKILSVVLAVVMVFSLCTVAFAGVNFNADGSTKVTFNEDGTFKILHVNDLQDTQSMKAKTTQFIKAAIESEKPDLAIIPGDNLSDTMTYLGTTKAKMTKAIQNICKPFEDAGIPFAVTFGNHDHDLEDVMSKEDQMAVYRSFSKCVWAEGPDVATFNIPVYSHDGSKIVTNIYIIDSNNKDSKTSVNGYTGLYPEQVQWYKDTSNALKAANGGKVVPSLIFQHVPVKEIYDCLTEVDKSKANIATYSTETKKWYVLDKQYVISPADQTVLGEAPCSEGQDTSTGEYEAWLEQGDIMGVFYGHDHVNNFVVKDKNGIVQGYTGGAGFNAYGDGDKRTMRVFNLTEDDVENYETHSIYYKDICGSVSFVFSDIMSTAIFGNILRFIYRLFGITPWN